MPCTFWHENYGDAQLMCCSHLCVTRCALDRLGRTLTDHPQLGSGSHKCVLLIFQLNWLVHSPFWGINYVIFLCITSFNFNNLKIPRVVCAHFFFKIDHLPCFKILWTNLVVSSKVVHEKSTINIEWNALKSTFSWAWEVKVQYGVLDCMPHGSY